MNPSPPEISAEWGVEVSAPSRLHFGLMSFGQDKGRRFGGVGAMIDQPRLRLTISPSEEFQVAGEGAERAAQFASRWGEFHSYSKLPSCRIEIANLPPMHTGLGVGTQLGLSVAAGLTAYCQLPMPSPAELAISVGRGLRSAVGTHGFGQGGLIAEGGKMADERISPLDCRVELPAAWRFVMVCPLEQIGLSGDTEQHAFGSLPAVSAQTTNALQAEARDCLVPAAATAEFARFSASLYRYGRLSGECFAAQQGGPYNGELLTEIVGAIRGLGVEGVGQTSWGPTIYAVLPNQVEARSLLDTLRQVYKTEDFNSWISEPNNQGVHVQVGTRCSSIHQSGAS